MHLAGPNVSWRLCGCSPCGSARQGATERLPSVPARRARCPWCKKIGSRERGRQAAVRSAKKDKSTAAYADFESLAESSLCSAHAQRPGVRAIDIRVRGAGQARSQSASRMFDWSTRHGEVPSVDGS